MKVIKPIPITSAELVSTTATETVALWDVATTYALNDQARLDTRIYQCVMGPNTGHAVTDAAWWIDVGPANQWAMFDSEIGTQTQAASTFTVVLKPGYCNGLALFGLVGNTAEITVRDALAGAIVYGNDTLTGPKIINLDGTIITDWYQYYFEPFVQRGDVVLSDLPIFGDAHITITITGTGTVKCGVCLVGTAYTLGDAEYGATAGITDYSRKDTSAFGDTTFVRRAYSKRMSVKLMLPNAQLNKVHSVLADVRAMPCAWIGTDTSGFEPLNVFGFYRDFSIDVAYATASYCSLEIEGLT